MYVDRACIGKNINSLVTSFMTLHYVLKKEAPPLKNLVQEISLKSHRDLG